MMRPSSTVTSDVSRKYIELSILKLFHSQQAKLKDFQEKQERKKRLNLPIKQN